MTRNEPFANDIHPLSPPPLPATGEHWGLFIDIDGTLVDFASHPGQVRIDTDTRELLTRLACSLDGALAVLSGRALSDVDRMLSPMTLPAGAMHGLELRDSMGRVTPSRPPGEVADNVGRACMEAIKALNGVWIENKEGIGFALHFRAARSQEHAVLRVAQEIADSSAGQYVVQCGDCVVELRPSGRDKGMALRALLETPPFRDRRPIVLGDDLTDETAFKAATELDGFGIIVGARRPTLARYGLASPQAVLGWLDDLTGYFDEIGRSP